MWDAEELPNGSIRIIQNGKGIFESSDKGQTWKVNTQLAQVIKLTAKETDLVDLFLNLHAGYAFFGDNQWIWIDGLGGASIIVILSGLLLWKITYRPKNKIYHLNHLKN